MIFDQTNMFSQAQAVVAPVRSTNTIDRGQPGIPKFAPAAFAPDMGKGSRAWLRIQITETFAGAFTTLEVALQTDDNTAFSSPKEVAKITLTQAQAVAGVVIALDDLPRGTDERYISLFYNLTGTATATAGKITAGIVMGADEWFR